MIRVAKLNGLTSCSDGANVAPSVIAPRLFSTDHLRAVVTALAATAGGALANLAHVPLAWMIGALAATATLAWNERAVVPPWARPTALVLLGLGLGQTFSGPVLGALIASLPAIMAASLLAILSGVVITPLFMRMARTDAETGYFCSVPGGVIVMAVLAQRAGASVPTVTLAQTLRVIVVVFLFPPAIILLAPHGDASAFQAAREALNAWGLAALVAGGTGTAFLFRRFGLANPWMMGPCSLAILLAATGSLPSSVPMDLVNAAQVAMGATLGSRMTRKFLLGSSRLATASLASAFLLSALLALLSLPIAWWGGLPLPAVLLGMAPGGMPEMAVTAKALDMAVPLVLSFHLTRTVFCNLFIGPIWTVIARILRTSTQ